MRSPVDFDAASGSSLRVLRIWTMRVCRVDELSGSGIAWRGQFRQTSAISLKVVICEIFSEGFRGQEDRADRV